MRRSKNIVPKTPSFALIVDGDTEVWYLQMLKRNERNIRIKITPEIPNKKNIEEQFKLVIKLSKSEYTKVFWIVDLDTLIKIQESKKSPINAFNDYKSTLNKKYPNVIIIVNNPCLEFWFLIHFVKTSKYFDTCSSAEKELKKYLNNYEKTQKFFTKQDDDIYLKLKSSLKIGIENSKALGNFNYQYPKKAISEMGLFFLTDELKKHFE